jgi:SAM-dependent methyltransferase
MDAATQRALTAHTRRFYHEHAAHFSATRDHPWPGWERVIAGWRPATPLRVLDVGCGNGRLASWLSQVRDAPIAYTGVDACETLLEAARGRCPDARLVHADLSLAVDASLPRGPFDLVCAFGLLHHIAGFARRRELVAALGQRTAREGRLALAFWRFAERSRFARHRLDWAAVPGIDEARLERGDHLLAWGEAGAARYCHASDDAEIDSLAERTGLAVRDDFEADGREGDLNRYLVLERP